MSKILPEFLPTFCHRGFTFYPYASKVHWWQCQDPNNKKCGWILDFTNPDAFEWQTTAFRNLVENYGIGGRENND